MGKTLLDGEGDDLDRNALREGMMGCVQDLHEVPLNDRRADAGRGDEMSISITSRDRVWSSARTQIRRSARCLQ